MVKKIKIITIQAFGIYIFRHQVWDKEDFTFLHKAQRYFKSLDLISTWFLAGFPKAPPTPPSLSRKLENSSEHAHVSMTQHLKMSIVSTLRAFKSVHFVIFAMVAGNSILYSCLL